MKFSALFRAARWVILPLSFLPLHASAAVPSPPTRSLLDGKPGVKGMVTGSRLNALYGAPLATKDEYPAAATTDEFVAAFLNDPVHGADSFGVDNVVLSLVDQILIRDGEITVYTYEQRIEGLPVHGSAVRLPVLHGTPDKIMLANIQLVPAPENPLPNDIVTAAGAIASVQQSQEYGHLSDFDDPTDAVKLVFEDGAQVMHRAYRFSGWDADEAFLFFVDTNSGDIVGALDQVLHGTVSGKVSGYGTPGVSADADPNCQDCCSVDPAPGQGAPCCLSPTAGALCYYREHCLFNIVIGRRRPRVPRGSSCERYRVFLGCFADTSERSVPVSAG